MTQMNQAGRRAAREGKDAVGVLQSRHVSIDGFELREVANGTGGVNLTFTGYASITCASRTDLTNAYPMEDYAGEYEEAVIRGAFSKTLAEGADVAFLPNHGAGGALTMARTKAGSLILAEDSSGLHVEALLNAGRADVQILKSAVNDGAITEMSFAFRIIRQTWSYAEENGVIDRRFIEEVNLNQGDVSPVNFAANPGTADLISMRNRRREGRSGRSDSPSPIVLPDHVSSARVALARVGRTPPQSKPTAGQPSDATREARRKLAVARHKARL